MEERNRYIMFTASYLFQNESPIYFEKWALIINKSFSIV